MSSREQQNIFRPSGCLCSSTCYLVTWLFFAWIFFLFFRARIGSVPAPPMTRANTLAFNSTLRIIPLKIGVGASVK